MTSYQLYYKDGAFQIVQIDDYDGNRTAFVIETFIGPFEEALKRYEIYLTNDPTYNYWGSFGIKLS
jgi:hypothetical protein